MLEQISHQWYEIEQWCLKSEWMYRNELQSIEHIIHSNRKWTEFRNHTLLCTTISHEVIFLITSLEFILHSLLYSSAVISIVGECMFTHSIFDTTLSQSKQLLCTKLSKIIGVQSWKFDKCLFSYYLLCLQKKQLLKKWMMHSDNLISVYSNPSSTDVHLGIAQL